MKVLHVININGLGGAEKLLLQLLPALSKTIETGCIIFNQQNVSAAANQIAGELRGQGIVVHNFEYTNKIKDKSILLNIRHIALDGKYDLIHSHLKHADTWLAILKRRKKISIPVVSTMHGYRDEYQNKYGFTISKTLFFSPYYHISRLIFKELDGFILVSNIVGDFFKKSGLIKNKKTAIIHHGYVSSARRPFKEIGTAEINLTLPGRLIKTKGHSYAIEAITKLSTYNKKIFLHIYGEGPARKELEEQIAAAGLTDRIFLHGYVDNLVERVRESDIALIPSLWEGFGVVFLDAFAAGLPVVGFDLPAGNEIIQDRHNGLLAIPYDSSSLALKVQELIGNNELAETLVNNAYHDLETKFSMKRMCADYEQFYSTMIKN